ncbi:MAG: sulfatase-like hydrolase/transferase [Planctomycetota bacterium]
MKQPNILFIISDEHSPNTIGCYGADYAITPNLDRLAAGGTLFENAYCNHAICVPSRNTLMSGLQSHHIGAYDNGAPLASDLPTWAHMLSRAGYRAVLDGKMHFLGPDQLHGFQDHWNEEPAQVAGFRWGEENGNATGYRYFTTVHALGDPSEHRNWEREEQIRADAIDFLQQQDDASPFCLTVGFNHPHYPMVCSKKALALYDDVEIPDPVGSEGLNPWHRHWGEPIWGFHKMTGDEVAASRKAYLAMVTMLDGWVGEILDTLQARGLAENTVVVYTTDHGDMWGEHGLWAKSVFYEDSAHVPLIIAGEGLGLRAGQRVTTPVSLLDLYPTFRDLAGITDWDVPLDGRSLVPALRGEPLPDAPVFCEYYGCDIKGPQRMVRYGEYKLCYYHRQGIELFHLPTDPKETRNLAADPAHQEALGDLLRMLMEGWDPERIAAEVRVSQNRRTLLGEGLKAVMGKDYRAAL